MTMPVSQRKRDGGKLSGPQNVPSVIEIVCQGTLPNGKLNPKAIGLCLKAELI